MDNLRLAIRDSDAQVSHQALPQVLGDGSQLVRVLQNLIGNALKFRGEEAPRVHVEAAEADGMWEFSVRDNGIGIASQNQERIFMMFQRLHNNQEYPGTGIGLAVCKRIVERHGGRIWVESEPGEGSTFRFTLPAVTPT
jgi:light-regulated signal transduction histidine kinase (bacteriophytochrome)